MPELYSLFIASCTLVTELPGFGQMPFGLTRQIISGGYDLIACVLAHLRIIFLEEIDDSNIVLERHLMSHRKGFKARHVTLVYLDGSKDIFRQTYGVQLEVGLEKEVDNVINTPFSRLFERCPAPKLARVRRAQSLVSIPVAKTKLENAV